MINSFTHLLFAILFLFSSYSFSQNSFTEDFNDNNLATGWFGNTHYKLAETNQELAVTVNGTSLWESCGLNLPTVVNMANNPYVSLKFKTSSNLPCTFGVYVLDNNNNNTVVIQKILKPQIYGEYTFSFKNLFKANNIDSTNIVKMLFIWNPMYSATGVFYLDDINVGSTAKVYPNIYGIPDQTVFMNATEQTVNLRGINDGTTGTNTISISASSSDQSIVPNPTIIYTSPNKTAVLKYTPASNKTGDVVITVKVSAAGADDNNINFNVKVSGNLAPLIGTVGKKLVTMSVANIIDIPGIDDGNPEVKQDMTVTAVSSNTSIIPNPSVNYTSDNSHAFLSINPVAAGNATITVTVKDNGGTAGGATDTKSMSFDVQAYKSINHVPTINSVAMQSASLNVPQTINLSGITDGDNNTQPLNVTATHTSQSAITTPVITYSSGSNTALLKYTPQTTGTDTIIVTVADAGGNADNNGDLSVTTKIIVNIIATLPTGMVEDFSIQGGRSWGFYPGPFEALNEENNSLHVRLDKDAQKWGDNFGTTLGQTLDLRKYPYVSMKIRSDQTFKIQVFLYDADNVNVSSDTRVVKGSADFKEFLFDWSNNQSPDGGKTFIDLSRITLLFFIINIGEAVHQDFYISEVRIGDQAHGIPLPTVTMSRTADQSLYINANQQVINLFDISPGFGTTQQVTISATSSNTALVPAPAVTVVNDGKAVLSYTPIAGATGNAQIFLEASATGSETFKDTFDITVLSSNSSTAETVALDLGTTYQRIEGLGAFACSANIDLAVKDLGLYVERLSIPTAFEQVNDNSDASIINRSGYNKSVIDFDAIKALKSAGIEKFIASLWSPPAWMKMSFHEEAPQAWSDGNDRLDPFYYDEFAEYLAAYIKVVKEETGIDLYAISIQNELEFEEFYGGCLYTPEEYKNVVIAVGRRFKADGIPTKLFGPENLYNQSGPEPYISAINNDAEAKQYFDIVAVHYTESRENWSSAHQTAMEAPQKSLWVSEAGAGAGENSVSYYWANAMSTANALYNALNYQYGSANGWVYWSFASTLLDPSNQPTPGYWVTKNYSKYIRSNAVQVNSTSTNTDILVTAYHHVQDSSLTVVLINNNSTPMEVKFTGITGNDLPNKFHVFRSAEYVNFMEVDSLKPVENNIVLLPAKSVTTIYGTGSKKVIAALNTELQTNSQLSIYPNPVANELNVTIPKGNYSSITVTDLLGRQLINKQIKAGTLQAKLDVGYLPKGLYLINLNGESKLNGKFIVE